MLLINFGFNYFKRHNFWTLTSCYGKFNQENMYQTLSVEDMTKTFWCVFFSSQF